MQHICDQPALDEHRPWPNSVALLRDRPYGPILDPDASPRRDHKQPEKPKKKINNEN